MYNYREFLPSKSGTSLSTPYSQRGISAFYFCLKKITEGHDDLFRMAVCLSDTLVNFVIVMVLNKFRRYLVKHSKEVFFIIFVQLKVPGSFKFYYLKIK